MSDHCRVKESVPLSVVRDHIIDHITEAVVLLLAESMPAVLITTVCVVLSQLLDGLVVDAVSADGWGPLKSLHRSHIKRDGTLKLGLVDVIVFLEVYDGSYREYSSRDMSHPHCTDRRKSAPHGLHEAP